MYLRSGFAVLISSGAQSQTSLFAFHDIRTWAGSKFH